MGGSKWYRPWKWNSKDWLMAGLGAVTGGALTGGAGLALALTGASAGAGAGVAIGDALKIKPPKQTIPEGGGYDFDLGEYTAAMQEQMAAQARAQEEYARMMAHLQEDQLRMQQEAQELANVESLKDPSDYPAAGADTARRRMMLRRGLMSTFTRYGGGSTSGGAGSAKAAKLGG